MSDQYVIDAIVSVPPHLETFATSQITPQFLTVIIISLIKALITYTNSDWIQLLLQTDMSVINANTYTAFGERALKNALSLYQKTANEHIVIKSHILHSIIKVSKSLAVRFAHKNIIVTDTEDSTLYEVFVSISNYLETCSQCAFGCPPNRSSSRAGKRYVRSWPPKE